MGTDSGLLLLDRSGHGKGTQGEEEKILIEERVILIKGEVHVHCECVCTKIRDEI